jgi:hypothetical protein
MDNPIGSYPGTISGILPPGSEVTTESASPKFALGTRHVLGDRVFRYAHVKSDAKPGWAANTLRRGSVCVSYNTASIEKGTQLGALTTGAESVLWTVVQRSVLKDQFKNGYLLMQGGYVKGIESNNAEVKGNTIALKLKEPLTEADASSGNYGILCEGLYSNVMERTYGNTGPGLIVGVPVADLTEGYYGWLQTWGPCGVIGTAATLNDSGQVTGEAPSLDTSSTNQIIATNPAMTQEERIIGYNVPYNTTNWDNESYKMLFLNISP